MVFALCTTGETDKVGLACWLATVGTGRTQQRASRGLDCSFNTPELPTYSVFATKASQRVQSGAARREHTSLQIRPNRWTEGHRVYLVTTSTFVFYFFSIPLCTRTARKTASCAYLRAGQSTA